MTGLPLLAKTSFILNVVAFLFVISCIALILIILVQKGRGGGLSSAFGGGMASGILGSKTGDFLTWVTIILASITLMLAVILVKFYKPIGYSSTISSGTQNTQSRTEIPVQNTGTGVSGEEQDNEGTVSEIPGSEETTSAAGNTGAPVEMPSTNGDVNSSAN